MNDDLISREALKKVIFAKTDSVEDLWDTAGVLNVINNAPTVLHDNYSMGYQDGVKKVLSERPQGEWVVDEEHSITMTFYKCTNCDWFGGATYFRYCPICGADMRKEAEE